MRITSEYTKKALLSFMIGLGFLMTLFTNLVLVWADDSSRTAVKESSGHEILPGEYPARNKNEKKVKIKVGSTRPIDPGRERPDQPRKTELDPNRPEFKTDVKIMPLEQKGLDKTSLKERKRPRMSAKEQEDLRNGAPQESIIKVFGEDGVEKNIKVTVKPLDLGEEKGVRSERKTSIKSATVVEVGKIDPVTNQKADKKANMEVIKIHNKSNDGPKAEAGPKDEKQKGQF